MIPRMLRPTTHRDLRTELFGHKLESPLLIAPVGVQVIFHRDKELGVAEMATEIGVPYILSTAASSSIEEVAKASGDGVRFFQLYWPQDDEITISVSLSYSLSLNDFFHPEADGYTTFSSFVGPNGTAIRSSL